MSECPFELPVRLNKNGHFVCGKGKSYRDLTPRLSMLSKHKPYIVQAINCHEKLIKALEEIKEHENYLDISNVYYDAQVFTISEQALKEAEKE